MQGTMRRFVHWAIFGMPKPPPVPARVLPPREPRCRHEGEPWCVVHNRLFVMESRCDAFYDPDPIR